MDIGLENRLDRVLISLVWESKGRSHFGKIRAIVLGEYQGARTLGKIRAIASDFTVIQKY
ncbi:MULTISPECIES: hypothetical protein [unclassified Microcoleus]|uniref:hypothetical protein n=1 Tax=unclassified Microcoleus TaxID=2642155 RepID=UPI002FCFCC3B